MKVYELTIFYSALTLASPEVRFVIDSETHDPLDVATKQILYVIFVKSIHIIVIHLMRSLRREHFCMQPTLEQAY